MSIIQDALRRREQDGGANPPESGRPSLAPPPPADARPPQRFPPLPVSPIEMPPPIPAGPPVPPTVVRHRGAGWLAVVIALLLAAGGTGFWGYRAGWFDRGVVDPQPAESTTVAVKPAPASSVGQLIQTVRDVVREEQSRSVESPALPTVPAPPQAPAAPAAPAPAPGPASSPEAAPAAPVHSSPSMLDRLRGTKDRAWPKFTVRGVLSRAGERPGMVILDQEMLEEGRVSRHGIRVVEVKAQTAVLEYQNDRRTYRAGEGEP